MNTSLGYLKKALTNERVLLAGGGDKALNDFTSKIEGKINLTSTSAILAALESLSQDGDYKIYIIADSDGNLPSDKPAVTIPSSCIKRLTATIVGSNLTSLIPDSLFSSRGANVSDLIMIARITTTIGELKNVYGNIIPGDNSTTVSMYNYKILATNDAKPTGYTSNGYVVSDGVMGLESPWDKVLINKIPSLETLMASKLTVYTGSVNAGNGSDVYPLGLFTNVTTGRTDGAVGNWVMLNSGGWDNNAQLAIDKGNGALYSRLVSGSWGRVLRNLDNIGGIDHGYTVYLNSTGSYNFAHPLSIRNSSRTDGLTTVFSIGGPDDYLGVGYFGFVYKGDTSTNDGLANFATIGLYNQDYIINATAAGKVGIGTTTPTEKLEVNGDILALSYKTGSCYITSDDTYGTHLIACGPSAISLLAGSDTTNGALNLIVDGTGTASISAATTSIMGTTSASVIGGTVYIGKSSRTYDIDLECAESLEVYSSELLFWASTSFTAAAPNINLNGTTKINNNTVWHAGNDGAGSGLDADLLDGCDLGPANGNVMKLAEFPVYLDFNGENASTEDYSWYSGTGTEDYLKAICRWAINTYYYPSAERITLIGKGRANSEGTIIMNLYADAGATSNHLPTYCSGIYIPLSLSEPIIKFMTNNGTWTMLVMATTSIVNNYLPLSGGTLSNANYGGLLTINRNTTSGDPSIVYSNNTGELGRIGFTNNSTPYAYVTFNLGSTIYSLIHSGNISNYITNGKLAVYPTNSASYTINPNKEYFLGNLSSDTTINLSSPINATTEVNEYKINFRPTRNNLNINITPASSIKWEKDFTPIAWRRYEISILYNNANSKYYAIYSVWNDLT